MINLERVTITGADDSTNVNDLVAFSKEFPFVEWGILVSKYKNQARFPSLQWIDNFSSLAKVNNLNVATHICGKWVRELLKGDMEWEALPTCVDVSNRIQINTHAELLPSNVAFIYNLERKKEKTFIFQFDGVNDHLASVAKEAKLKVEILFDTSGGAGILPSYWKPAMGLIPSGYAGGLCADNIFNQLQKISEVCPYPFWIDMERRVRTYDDAKLDLDQVRAILKITKSIVEKAKEEKAKGYASMH